MEKKYNIKARPLKPKQSDADYQKNSNEELNRDFGLAFRLNL
jgi:hypothetical protein